MDEATKQALNEFIQKIIAGAELAVGHAPVLVQEWLRWQLIRVSVATAIFFALSLAAFLLARFAKRYKDEHPYSDAEVGVVFGLVISIGFGLLTIGSCLDIVKVLVAPSVVILEKFASLVN